MPSYTLYYFNGRGRAEICRMLFAVGGVPYNDKRIEFNEWNNFKNNIPCSWMPVLEIDGKTHFPQSMAIARYLAREFGFYGKNTLEMAKIDYITDCFYDILDDYMRMYHEKDGRMMMAMGTDTRQKSPEMTAEMRMRYMDTCKKVLPFLEKTLEGQNGGNQFFMGDQISLCDLMCYAALENPMNDDQTTFSDYPKLRGLRARIAQHPKLSPYFTKRTSTDF